MTDPTRNTDAFATINPADLIRIRAALVAESARLAELAQTYDTPSSVRSFCKTEQGAIDMILQDVQVGLSAVGGTGWGS